MVEVLDILLDVVHEQVEFWVTRGTGSYAQLVDQLATLVVVCVHALPVSVEQGEDLDQLDNTQVLFLDLWVQLVRALVAEVVAVSHAVVLELLGVEHHVGEGFQVGHVVLLVA